jgi:NADPH:quinone reductase-like Zn-dependent oxidoreductase
MVAGYREIAEIKEFLGCGGGFVAIVHGEYGAGEDVLRLADCQFKSEELGPDDVLVQVTARPVHPGDIQILSALPQGGRVVPIPEGTQSTWV